MDRNIKRFLSNSFVLIILCLCSNIGYSTNNSLYYVKNATEENSSSQETQENSSSQVTEENTSSQETEENSSSQVIEGGIADLFSEFGHYLDRTRLLTIGELQSLPIGLQKKIGNTTCDLLVTEASFGSDYTEITVYLRIKSPKYDGGELTLYFGGENIRISASGGYIGDVKLALLSEVSFGSKGNAFRLVLNPASKRGELPASYAIIDCEGFKEMQISGKLIVPQDYARPIYNGEPLTNRELEMDFSCKAEGLDRIMGEVNIPEFSLTALPDFRFEAKRAFIDLSTNENAPSMDYYSIPGEKLYDGFPDMWTGLYIENLSVHFPSYIKDKSIGGSPVFELDRLWLDERGFSGVMSVQNILDINKGDIGGWRFSIDELGVTIVANQVKKGNMEGELALPISMKNRFKYTADFDTKGQWKMKVKVQEKMSFDLWKANSVEINKNSYVKVEKKGSKDVLLEACLSGKMLLDPTAKPSSDTSSKPKGKFKFENINFSNLKVRNEKPYLSLEKISCEGDVHVGNFPVALNKIGLTLLEEKASLDFGLQVKLFKIGKNNSIKGDLDFSIKSKYQNDKEGDSAKKWIFAGVGINEISVDFENVAFRINGKAKFFEDNKLYGDGFQGEMGMKIKAGLKLGFDATLMFGSMPSYRYWYADVLFGFGGAGIPIFPGFQIGGIGGGAYQHMKMDSDYESNTLGERLTQTGVRYIPDSTISFGFKAFCRITTQAEPDMFNADLALSMGFTTSGGLDHITLQGVAKLLAQVDLGALANASEKIIRAVKSDTNQIKKDRKAASGDAAFTAVAQITYDHSNKSFYGLFDSYLNMGLIKGTGPDGNVGNCQIYFSDEKWFVNIGTPEQRLGVKMNLGLMNIKLGCYFITGHDLPAMPKIPSKLDRLLKTEEKNIVNSRAVSQIQGGKGFAFGSSLSLNTGDLNFWLLYARFETEIGFDIMLKKYKGVFCAGKSELLGLNGWYATGQAYAYLYGDIGLKLKIFGAKRNFSILQGEMGALLEAQLPRPAYFGGGIGLNFSVLGGLIHGYCNFKFSLGEKCEMFESGFADGMEVIADIRPVDKAQTVDVFSVPQASFNLPVEKEVDAVFDGESSELKIILDNCSVLGSGKEINCKIEWDKEKKVASVIPHDILPPNTNCSIDVGISVKEKKGSAWKDLNTIEGGKYVEGKAQYFTTGSAPDSIPWRNVKTMYPVRDQKYFYTGESTKGWVELDKGQPYLFEDSSYRRRVYFVSSKGDTLSSAFTYNKRDKKVNFYIPKLKKDEGYTMSLALEYKKGNTSSNNAGNGQAAESGVNANVLSSGENSLSSISNILEEDVVQTGKKKIIFSTHFSTSKYEKMSDKISAVQLGQVFRVPYILVTDGNKLSPSPEVHYLQSEMKAEEGFDVVELNGNQWSGGALIETKAVLDKERYYTDNIYGLVYKNYPYQGYVNFDRNPEHPQIIPDWAIYVSSYYKFGDLEFFPWMYYLPYHYYKDFNDVIIGISNSRLPYNHEYRRLIRKPFVPMQAGDYPIKFRYSLPDGSYGSSTEKIMKNIIE